MLMAAQQQPRHGQSQFRHEAHTVLYYSPQYTTCPAGLADTAMFVTCAGCTQLDKSCILHKHQLLQTFHWKECAAVREGQQRSNHLPACCPMSAAV